MLLNRNVDRMTLADIIDARAVLPAVKAQNKKQVLQELSQAIASLVAVDQRVIYETLHRREKLGSTGLGQGIAIPHGRLPNINRVYGLFARLATPVDFESVDGQPVDLVFVFAGPRSRRCRSPDGTRPHFASAA